MKNFRETVSGLLALWAVLLCFAGCDGASSRTYMSVSKETSHSFSMEYKEFDGQKEQKIKVKEGEELAVEVSVTTKGGSLAIQIAKGDEEPVYTGHDLPTGTFTVYLKESGTYTVTLTAKEHVGSYSFDWGA